ncbi:MAG: rod shape-determining protein MreC [Cyanobacteria bacterium SZAS LIN-2]|nr:rod shape-determining protein MreC [Cyanobacteria bacterium SZAS LIN-3]MBS1995645.1 rod shape-determining protein MreC [Cyanobacteria bacterium SZAS LIN-2]MBS2008194.1 rod shape-determining protein MreC [Cyanobacteria bacterium SZAS TMP-1]
MARKESDIEAQSQSIAEYVFLVMVVLMVAVPASGFVLSAQSGIAGIFAKGALQVQSTKDLAQQLLDSSARIHALERKLAQDELELARLKQQSRDSSRLRSLLELKQKSERTTVAAEVVARNPDNWFEQVVIDKGSADKVTKGSAVISVSGVIGQVVSCSEHASVVRLLTDPEQKLGVLIPRLGVTGILVGDHEKNAHIDFVPVGTNVDAGDKVVCLGKAGTFPDNHPVGTVAAVRRDANGASMQIDVKLSDNCYDVSQVLVLPPLAN